MLGGGQNLFVSDEDCRVIEAYIVTPSSDAAAPSAGTRDLNVLASQQYIDVTPDGQVRKRVLIYGGRGHCTDSGPLHG